MGSPEETQALIEFSNLISSSLEVWGLKGEEGWAICPSIEFEETDVLPFFSSEKLAQVLCNGEWASYKPETIPLESFLEDWLPGMHEDNAMVGVNWNSDMEGPELEPSDIAACISSELQK